MTDLVLRNIDDDVRGKLEELASSHGRSVEAEAREILRDAVTAAAPTAPAVAPEPGLGTRLAALFSGRGIGLTEEEAKGMEVRGYPVKPFEFDR